jgi:putative hydrolase of HD superfamily
MTEDLGTEGGPLADGAGEGAWPEEGDAREPGLEQGASPADRFERQLRFLVEIDRLKTIIRRTRITDHSRYENSAEHSWHLAMMAVLLHEHAPPGVDVLHAVELVLVHDIVEIDAGDTDWHDAAAVVDKPERERAAAVRLFGLLPSDQSSRLLALWEEFEAGQTPAARYANALDRVQPMLLVRYAQDGDWALRSSTPEPLLGRMAPVEEGCPALWTFVQRVIEEAFSSGRYGREQ